MAELASRAMTDLHQIRGFCAVAKHKGYAPAARALGIDERRLGHDVMRLERSLGIRLVNRDTRYRGLTKQGTVYFAHMAPLVAKLETVMDLLRTGRLGPPDAGETAKPR